MFACGFVFTKRILDSPGSADDRKRDFIFPYKPTAAVPNFSDAREPYRLESRTLRAEKHLERTALTTRLIQNLWCQI